MTTQPDVITQRVFSALENDARLRSQLRELEVTVCDGYLVLEGSVDDIVAKRLIPRLAINATGGMGVRDRLQLRHAQATIRKDKFLAQMVRRTLAEEPLLSDYPVRAGEISNSDDPRALVIFADAHGGTVRLSGTVGSLRDRRFAEVLVWWTGGCLDVENRLYVSPRQQDTDGEITEAIRLVLERDPWIDAAQVDVVTVDRVVHLTGILPEPAQAQIAESDVWYVPGIADVRNDIVSCDWEALQRKTDEAILESFPASDPPAQSPVTGVGGLRG